MWSTKSVDFETIKNDIQNIDKVVGIIKKEEITASDLEVLSKCFNNSIVGTSKLFYA